MEFVRKKKEKTLKTKIHSLKKKKNTFVVKGVFVHL